MSQQSSQYTTDALATTPAILARLAAPLMPEKLCRKESAGEWSILEHICHLRDIEQEGYALRIERILNEMQPSLPDIDGSALAVERHYNEQNIDEALAAFSHAREANVHIIKNLTVEQMQRRGSLEGIGLISLEELLAMMHKHDQEHLKELEALQKRLIEQK